VTFDLLLVTCSLLVPYLWDMAQCAVFLVHLHRLDLCFCHHQKNKPKRCLKTRCKKDGPYKLWQDSSKWHSIALASKNVSTSAAGCRVLCSFFLFLFLTCGTWLKVPSSWFTCTGLTSAFATPLIAWSRLSVGTAHRTELCVTHRVHREPLSTAQLANHWNRRHRKRAVLPFKI
jgi:hypothetical protein